MNTPQQFDAVLVEWIDSKITNHLGWAPAAEYLADKHVTPPLMISVGILLQHDAEKIVLAGTRHGVRDVVNHALVIPAGTVRSVRSLGPTLPSPHKSQARKGR